jgi:chromosome segregation ATPase
MPDPHYTDHLTEQLRADIQRLEQQLADTLDRVKFAEARLHDELLEKQALVNTSARLANELADAENRLARCRNGGTG